MGAASTKNVAEVTAEAISNVSTDIVSRTKLSTNSSQIIYVRDAGDVKISGITQTIAVDINMSALMSAMSSTEAQQSLSQELTQAAKSVVSGINLFQYTDATNQMTAMMRASMTVATNIEQACEALTNTSQAVVVEQASGYVEITDVSQKAMTSILSSCVQDAVGSTRTVQDLQQTLDQSAEALSKGIDVWALVVMALIGLLALVLPMVIGGTTITTTILSLIFPLMMIGGIIFIAVYAKSEDVTISMTRYSKSIAAFSECGPQELSRSFEIATPAAAGNTCEENKSCVAFDWTGVQVDTDGTVVILDPPQTIFYADLGQNPCGPVLSNLDKQRLIFRPRVRQYYTNTEPPDSFLEGSNEGDVAVSKPRLQYYFFVDGVGWVMQPDQLTAEPLKEEFTAELFINSSSPNLADGENGDAWLDMSNPSLWKVWGKDEGTWVIVNEEVPGPGWAVQTGCEEATIEPISGTRYVTAFLETAKSWFVNKAIALYGGYHAEAAAALGLEDEDDQDGFTQLQLQQICGNVSGFKTVTKPTWMLIVGIGLIAVGIFGTGMAIFKSMRAKKHPEINENKKKKRGAKKAARKAKKAKKSKAPAVPVPAPAAT